MNWRPVALSAAVVVAVVMVVIAAVAIGRSVEDDGEGAPVEAVSTTTTEDPHPDVRVDAAKLYDSGQMTDVYTFCDPTTSGIRVYASSTGEGKALAAVVDPACIQLAEGDRGEAG